MYRKMIFAGCLVLSGVAIADDKIVALSPSSKTAIDLFDSAGGSPVRKIDASTLQLPVKIQARDESGRYLQMKFENKDYWLRARDVKVEMTSTSECTATNEKPTITGSTAGIASKVCP